MQPGDKNINEDLSDSNDLNDSLSQEQDHMNTQNDTNEDLNFDDASPEDTYDSDEDMPSIKDLAQVIEKLNDENNTLKERLVRSLADLENTRKRATRDRSEAEKFGGTRLARDILSVYDNLERALSNIDETTKAQHEALVEGIEITQKDLINAFDKNGIVRLSPEVGEKFDPNLHQAMFETPIPGTAAGTVIQVMQNGFTINERLLRPAMVGVSKEAPQEVPVEKTENKAVQEDNNDENQ